MSGRREGILKKEAFLFGIHSIFAIKSVSIFFMTTDIKLPVAIAMTAYAIIYLVFAFLTIGYYRKTVNEAL